MVISARLEWQTGGKIVKSTRSAEHAPDAAEALKLTAADLSRLGVVDTVVKEPVGGAHRNPEVSIDALGNAIEIALRQIQTDGVDGATLRKRRRERFLAMGG